MDEKVICIIQAGGLGDTLIALPIAKHYQKNGYLVDWVIHYKFKDIFRNIDYINNLIILPENINYINESISYAYSLLNNKTYDFIIDLSICFPHSKVNNYCNYGFLNNFVETKYYLANVDLNERWNLMFNRDLEREKKLFHLFDIKEKYIIIHDDSSIGKILNDINSDLRKIYFTQIEDYNIFDWYLLLENAEEIHCGDSSLCNLIESLNEFNQKKKIYYFNQNKTANKWLQTTLKNNWTING